MASMFLATVRITMNSYVQCGRGAPGATLTTMSTEKPLCVPMPWKRRQRQKVAAPAAASEEEQVSDAQAESDPGMRAPASGDDRHDLGI